MSEESGPRITRIDANGFKRKQPMAPDKKTTPTRLVKMLPLFAVIIIRVNSRDSRAILFSHSALCVLCGLAVILFHGREAFPKADSEPRQRTESNTITATAIISNE